MKHYEYYLLLNQFIYRGLYGRKNFPEGSKTRDKRKRRPPSRLRRDIPITRDRLPSKRGDKLESFQRLHPDAVSKSFNFKEIKSGYSACRIYKFWQ
jgi:hypothetical protein